ncbi:MAG: aromatic acid exporter family protein [Nocardioides sp.]|nr:aromatic acid exporter family protein [Nocardioides sp.]
MDSKAGAHPRTRAGRAREMLSSPEFITDLIQIIKCTVAATAAWWLSIHVLDSPIPFLAPWTALLTVHATVYRSLSRGAQTTVASTAGVALSLVIGQLLGVHLWTFALALFVGLLGSRLTWLRDEGIAIATTAVFILGSGFGDQAPLLDDRLLEVGLGVLVGVVVNLALIPPLRNQQAARYVDNINRRMGKVFVDMAEELEGTWSTDHADAWLSEMNALDNELDSAWQTVRFARESERMNPRIWTPILAERRRRAPQARGEEVDYEHILARIGEGVSHLRHLTRTVREATYAEREWDEDFRRKWVDIVRDAGRSIEDPDAEVEPIRDRLDRLADEFTPQEGHAGELWPIYGSLITSVRHVAVIVDDVASARRAREEPSPNPGA